MCNGDLGMYRVMPWAYPTIPGQSSGGASVDPTPEPSAKYYDFADARIVYTNDNVALDGYVSGTFKNRGYAFYRISGIKTLDSSNVNRVYLEFSIDPTYSPPVSGIVTIAETINLHGDLNGDQSYAVLTNDQGSTNKVLKMSGGTFKFTVYDSDGNALQTAEVPIT